MEEDAVLVVCKRVVDFLVPYDAAVGRRNVDQLEPEGVAYQVVGQHGSTLQARVRPSVAVGVGNVQFGDGDGVDLVGRLGHSALHRLLVLVGENRGHGRRRGGSFALRLEMVGGGQVVRQERARAAGGQGFRGPLGRLRLSTRWRVGVAGERVGSTWERPRQRGLVVGGWWW